MNNLWEKEFDNKLKIFGLNEEQTIMIILGIRTLLQYQKDRIKERIEYEVLNGRAKDEALEIINSI